MNDNKIDIAVIGTGKPTSGRTRCYASEAVKNGWSREMPTEPCLFITREPDGLGDYFYNFYRIVVVDKQKTLFRGDSFEIVSTIFFSVMIEYKIVELL